jgi:hypothetical protein
MLNIDRSTASFFGRRAGGVSGPASRSRHHRPRRRLSVEALESRALLSTFTVNSLGDTGMGSGTSGDLRFVITQVDQTPGNNTINFSVTGTIALNSALPDLSNTTGLTDIEGPGASSLTVSRSGASGTDDFRIFTIDTNANVKLVGLTIKGGSTGEGGGIATYSALTVTNSIITDNSAIGSGGGILVLSDGRLTVNNSTIADNSAGGGGGGIESYGALTVTSSTFADNSASYAGGGIANDGPLTVITNSTIADNSAGGGGGGIESGGALTLTNSP